MIVAKLIEALLEFPQDAVVTITTAQDDGRREVTAAFTVSILTVQPTFHTYYAEVNSLTINKNDAQEVVNFEVA